MLGRFALVVGVVASIVLCFQNAGSLLGFGWGLIQGAGPAALIAFAPLGLGLGTLWGGFRYLHGSNQRHASTMFTALALSTVRHYEVVLPTPLKSWGSERAMRAADVRSIRDEVLLSARGNPIGVRLTYDVAFPQTVVCHVEASGLFPRDGVGDDVLAAPARLATGGRVGSDPVPTEKSIWHAQHSLMALITDLRWGRWAIGGTIPTRSIARRCSI